MEEFRSARNRPVARAQHRLVEKRDKKRSKGAGEGPGESSTMDIATAINRAFVGESDKARPSGRTFRIVSTQAETAAHSTTQVSAVSRVLGNQELLRMAGHCEDPNERCHSWDLVPLARVNKAFWTIATDQIWECMHSIEPFFKVLVRGSIRVQGNVRVLSFPKGIAHQQWTRFNVHAAKVKTLIFSPPCPRTDPGWVAYLAVSKPSDMSWFPAAKRVFLLSDDPFSQFITVSVAHQLQSLRIRRPGSTVGPPEGQELELPILSAATAKTMKTLRLENTVSPAALYYQITRLRSLTCLHLKIPCHTKPTRLASSIGQLEALEELSIHQVLDAADTRSLKRAAPVLAEELLTDEGFEAALARPPTLAHLQALSVISGPSTQRLIAATLTPRTLNSLSLSTPASDITSIIPALHMYLRRNLGLVSVIVKPVAEVISGNADMSESSRVAPNEESNSKVFSTGAIFEALSLLPGLRKLDIEGIQLFGHGSGKQTPSQTMESSERSPTRITSVSDPPPDRSASASGQALGPQYLGEGDQRDASYGWHHLPPSITTHYQEGRLVGRGRAIGKRGRWA
ncbi:hypothetical protein FA13DRAFT_1736981 [Coprinellus micaceus]|uniref:Uncharacterized protein n=1 Tax=Coprinellus micaceus TaxID=71717 RepID=A0A4Y7SYM5_COPMI|nr:hypothetical protein FA13DRAFT_1736981 [Coprinellus micaceus]